MAPELGWDDAEVAAQIDTWHRIAGVEGLVPGRPKAEAAYLTRRRCMGIVNATPDSFSDRQGPKDPAELVERGPGAREPTARRSSTWAASRAAPTARPCPRTRRPRGSSR